MTIKNSGQHYKDALSKLDRADWDEAEDLLRQGSTNKAIEGMLLVVPSAVKAYSTTVRGFDLDRHELIAEGNLALVEAVMSWEAGGMSLKNWCYKQVGWALGKHVGKELSFGLTFAEELPDGDERETEAVEGSIDRNDTDITAENIDEWLTKTLSPREAELVQAVYYKQRSITDIAKMEGVSAAAISKVHRRALRKIRHGFK